MDTRYVIMKEIVQEKHILIENTWTNLILVDPITKCLTPKVFHGHVPHMDLGFEISIY